jgi:pSer/pThr/pTyr-binding forkhead associated (FHA) protein
MAELREANGTHRCVLLPEHLIGRGSQCALRLAAEKKYVSSQHAVIRWVGSGWEVLDRGSRNGTRLNGAAVEPGRAYRLAKGSTLTFGHSEERWSLSDASEPRVMALEVDSGEACVEHCGMIGIPSSENPKCTLFLDVDGDWKLEDADGTLSSLRDGETFEADGRKFRFSRPSSSALTAGAESATDALPPTLHFAVSSDEDFVELTLHYQNRTVALGSRAHNYLLLTLARQRLADQLDNVAPASRGWVDKDQLADGLRIAPPQIDGEIFRIRRHFASHGVPESAAIIERRARTRQIRLGLDQVIVDRR